MGMKDRESTTMRAGSFQEVSVEERRERRSAAGRKGGELVKCKWGCKGKGLTGGGVYDLVRHWIETEKERGQFSLGQGLKGRKVTVIGINFLFF